MSGSGWRAIQFVLGFASALIAASVLALPWRGVGQENPFHLGDKLYQMGLPLVTAALVVMAVAALAAGLAMRPGDWSSITMVLLGAGTIVLALVVHHSATSGAVIAGTKPFQAGLAVALLAGLLLLGAGVVDGIGSRRSSAR